MKKLTSLHRVLIGAAILLCSCRPHSDSFSAQAQTPVVAGALSRGPFLQMPRAGELSVVWQGGPRDNTVFEWHLGDGVWQPAKIERASPGAIARFRPPSATAGIYRLRVGNKILAQSSFHTPPASGTPFTFVVWGDSGVGGTGQWQIATLLAAQNPDFLLHTGDLIYPSGAARDYDPKFFKVYKSLIARAPFFGSLGNHDVVTANGQPFLNAFDLPRNGPAGVTPERNYSFEWGDVHIAVIDSTASESTQKKFIAPWLEGDMKRSRAAWKIVAFHHPPFSSGMHGDSRRIQRTLVPVFEQARVDVVFNGHDHLYERFAARNGVTYVVTGAGGAGRYRRAHTSAARSVKFFNDDWSITRVEVKGRIFKVRQIARDGRIVDEWTMAK